MSASSRRGILGSLAALAPAAALGATLPVANAAAIAATQPPGADTDLIASSIRICFLLDQLDQTDFDALPDIKEAEVANHHQGVLLGEVSRIIREMTPMRATTLAGLAARAIALGRMDPKHASDFEAVGRNSRTQLDALLRDGAALIGSLIPCPNPDAELLALRPEFDRLRALILEYNNGSEWDDREVCARWDDICCRVVGMPPAQTPEGLAFKAAAAMHQLRYAGGDVEDFEDDDAASAKWAPWRVLRELAGEVYQPTTSEGGAA